MNAKPTPTARYLDGTYMQFAQDWHVRDSPWKAGQVLQLLRRNGLEPGTMADVGCGAGEVLRCLSEALERTQFFGFELSPQAFQLSLSRQTARLKYFNEDVLESDMRFECLLCLDVFEHVEDYMGFLRRLRGKADYKVFHIPLDITVLSVLRMSMLKHRERVGHLHYFTQETGLATLRDCGYEIVDGFYTAHPNAQSILARLAWLPRRALASLSQRWSARLLGGSSYIVLAR
jgi:SAM-dependent methyltransferase